MASYEMPVTLPGMKEALLYPVSGGTMVAIALPPHGCGLFDAPGLKEILSLAEETPGFAK